METNPSSWPWFYRMNEAMEGRFAGAAPLLTPVVEDEDEDCEALSPSPRKRARRSRAGMAEFLTESEMDLLVEHEEKSRCGSLGDVQRLTDFSYKRKYLLGLQGGGCLSVCLSADFDLVAVTEENTRRLIELRAANESLFTGRRNTAKPAWR